MITYIIYGLCILICIYLMIDNIINKLRPSLILDEFTTNYYINYLDTLIKYKSVYYIDNAFGENFTYKNKITSEIDNDKISDAHEKIIIDINKKISPQAKKYLLLLYGEEWLSEYIRIQSLSIVLNYTKNTIEKLTIADFK